MLGTDQEGVESEEEENEDSGEDCLLEGENLGSEDL